MDVRKILLIIFLIAACNQTDSSEAVSTEDVSLSTFKDSLSYSIGINIGKNLPAYADIDKDLVQKGLDDFFENNEPLLDAAARQQVLREFNVSMAELERDEMRAQGEEHQRLSRENKIAGQEFLDENKTKEGVLVRRSNLQFKKITTGTGTVPDYDDVVTVHYNGYLIDGHKFDSSYDRGNAAIFPVKGVIAGWTEILQIMPVGSKWEVYIPYNLAYGEKGIQGSEKGTYVIPPSATLVFEIELIGISN
tara:strand:- start:1412 stop:2158 length:747 start_codon:yes stop_codon:yes gene_type:complete